MMNPTPPYSRAPARAPTLDESNTGLHPPTQDSSAPHACHDGHKRDIPAIILQPEEAALPACPLSDRREQKRE